MRLKRNRNISRDNGRAYPSPNSLASGTLASPVDGRIHRSQIVEEDSAAQCTWTSDLQTPISSVSDRGLNSNLVYDFDPVFDLTDFSPTRHEAPHEGFDYSLPFNDTTRLDPNVELHSESIDELEVATLTSVEDNSSQQQFTLAEKGQETSARTSKSAHTDGQCVLACCQIISQLESLIDARVRHLNLTLDVVKKTIKAVSTLMQASNRSSQRNMLFAAILYQIMELLETGCSGFLEQPPATRNNADFPQFDAIGGNLSGFDFGDFQEAANEQRAWRAKIVIKELLRVEELLRCLHNASSSGLQKDEPCHRDLQCRLAALTGQLQRAMNS